jgi:hypothetical protein
VALLAPVSFPYSRSEAAKTLTIAVLPFEIEDNSGELGSPGRHDAMLTGVTKAVNKEIEKSGLYVVAPQNRVEEAIKARNPGTYLRNCNGCELDIAKRLGAERVMIGWIFKMSTLIGTLHIRIEDVATGRVVYQKDFDFRGDDARAWGHAAQYFVGSLNYAL